jgi:uncharacterized protein
MNICVILNTPAQVHFYKNIIKRLESKGHKVTILAREYGDTIKLLNELKINYNKFNFMSNSPLKTVISFPVDLFNIYRILFNKRIDFIIGFGMYDVYVAKALHSKSIVFFDSEPKINSLMNLQYQLFMPFVNSFISPASFRQDLGEKHIKIDSYKELSYLHPRYFKPDVSIYELLDISPSEDYVVLRFNSFDALHDVSESGFSLNEKVELTNLLSKLTHVYISFEGQIPKELEQYRLKIPKRRIHDLLFFSKLLITDTQTMATEAAILGTPVIRKNKFVGKGDMGNFIDLENKYKLIYNLTDFDKVKELSLEILSNKSIKDIWRERRDKFLQDKIDIVDYMVNFIEKYNSK